MINDFTGQCRASALSPWGASGLSQCARRSKLTAPRWVISEHYLNVHTHTHLHILYIFCIYLVHSLSSTVMPFCPLLAWAVQIGFYKCCLIFIVSVTLWCWLAHGPVLRMARGESDSNLIWHDLVVHCKMAGARDKRLAMFIPLTSLDLYWIDL